jgi:predicted DCC family thiol-disulfide oxidoreductase YuxK
MVGNKEPFIVIFDDECGMCHNFVSFLLKIDKENKLTFAGRGSATGSQLRARAEKAVGSVNSVIVETNLHGGSQYYFYSDAALQIFKYLGWPWKALWLFSIVPRFIRDAVYKFIANRRHLIFAKPKECKILPAQKRKQFLE